MVEVNGKPSVGKGRKVATPGETREEGQKQQRPARKSSEYGTQLREKQKVKGLYGVRERYFVRMFSIANRKTGTPGEELLSLLERRIDNVVYRLKMAKTRSQARQLIVHGHVTVNGGRVSSPSYLVSVGDEVAIHQITSQKAEFMAQVVDKLMKVGAKVPEWLELDKKERKGRVLRDPSRKDIQNPINEHLIVELYSK
jgi:small subunit ribosomal protein S4